MRCYINENAWGLAVYYDKLFHFWQPYVKDYAPHWSWYTTPVVNTWLEK